MAETEAIEALGLDVNVREFSPGRGDSGATPGTTVLAADPVNRYHGMIWFRSDTLQLCVDVNGTVRRSAVFT